MCRSRCASMMKNVDLEGTNCIASRNRCAGMIMRTPIGEEREVYLVLELVR